jgi:hypothetical protein
MSFFENRTGFIVPRDFLFDHRRGNSRRRTFSSRHDSISQEIESLPAFLVAMTEEIATFSDEKCSMPEENDWLPKEAEHFADGIERVPAGTFAPLDVVHPSRRRNEKSPSDSLWGASQFRSSSSSSLPEPTNVVRDTDDDDRRMLPHFTRF